MLSTQQQTLLAAFGVPADQLPPQLHLPRPGQETVTPPERPRRKVETDPNVIAAFFGKV